jgi:hypothetical protein
MSQHTNETLALKASALEQAKAHLNVVLFLTYDTAKNGDANWVVKNFLSEFENIIRE